MNLDGLKYLVVGSGFFGATIAEKIASILNEKVLVIEERNYIGGNSHDYIDKETDIFTLEPIFMRSDAYFKPINVYYNKESNKYEETETAPKKESKKFNVNNFDQADHINRLGAIFRTQKEISYTELVEEIKQIYGIGTNGAKQKIIPYLTGNNFIKSIKGIYTRIWKF